MRRKDQQSLSRSIKHESEMFVPARARWNAVSNMTGEKGGQRGAFAHLLVDTSHDGASQGPGEPQGLGLICQPICDCECEHAFDPLDRRHQAKAQIATIADQEWARGAPREGDFDVPESSPGEACAGCKGFRTLPFG